MFAAPLRAAAQATQGRDGRRRLVELHVVEAREPHAEQPHRGRWRVRAQQGDGGLGHQLDVVGRAVERLRARDRRPVGEPDLDRDRPPTPPLLLQRLAQLARERAQDLLLLGVGLHVGVEGALGGHRLRRAGLGLHGRVVIERGAPLQVARPAVPEAVGELRLVGLLQLPDGGVAEFGQTLGRLGPDAGDTARRCGGEANARLLAPHGHEPGGLAQVRAALGDQPVGPDADRDLDPGCFLTCSTSSRSTRKGFSTPVRSAYASSIPIPCTASSRARTNVQTSRDFSR